MGLVWSQSTYQLVKKGNKKFETAEYTEAEVAYRKALDKDPSLGIVEYNLGSSKYQAGSHDNAISRFQKAVDSFQDKENKAHAYHNLGNSFLSKKEYEQSVESYKEALKLVPDDMDTKYNLAYAQQKLKEQQEQENQDQDQEEQENQDENQEKNDQEESDQQENQDQQEGDEEKESKDDSQDGGKDEPQDGEDEQEQEEPTEPKEGQLSKEQAEQILKMLENEEGKLQDKLDEPEGEPINISIEKDW